MKRFYNLIRDGVLFGFATLAMTATVVAQTQLPECESTVPFRIVDLSNDPDGTHYTDSIERLGQCICNTQNNQNFVSFYLTLNPNVAMVEIGIVGGADPSGSGTYWVLEDLDGIFNTPGTCAQETPGGEFMCIEGAGPHKIVYKKPGSNLVQYYIHQIPKPMFPASGVARVGCTIPFPIYGLDNVVITPLSNTGGFTTTQCSNMVVYDPTIDNYEFGAFPIASGSYPYTVTYKICGDQQAATECGLYAECDTVTMTVYPSLSLTLPTYATYCDGDPSGVTLTPTITGGFGPFQYSWTKDGAPYASTMSITVSDTADYVLTVSDSITSFNTSCVATAEVQVLIGNEGYINAGADQFICESDPTVYLAGMVQHTTGAYWTTTGTGTFSDTTILFGSYQSDTVTTTATYNPSAADMLADQIQLILHKQVAGCGASTDTLTIRFIEQVTTTPSAAPIACNGGTTTVNVVATGDPLSSFSYYWSTGQTGTSSILPSGTYSITAVDQYGCGDNTPITIANPDQLVLVMSSTNVSVDGLCDGGATVSISGGTSPYSVLWSGSGSTGQTTTTTTSTLCYGIHTVAVTDANGCQATSSVVVNKPSCSSFNVTAISTNVKCYGGNDGTATSSVTGGTPGYSYSWSPSGGTGSSANGLSSGTYTVTVTDAGGCIDVASVTILQPTAITNTMTHTDATNIPGTNGTATANPLGGTPGYTYLWTPSGQTTQTAINLASTVGGIMYYVTIKDNNLCQKVDSVRINQPPCNNFTLAVNTTNVSCYGGATGRAKLLIAHGTAPYTITWTGGIVAPDQMSVTGLAAGTYTVTVTDATGCTTFTTFSITQPNQLSLSLVPTNVTCNGMSVPDGTIDASVYGGTQPYQYAWTGSASGSTQDLNYLGTGFYFLTVTDNNKCTITGGASISTPPALGVTVVSSIDVTCYTASNGSINITPTGGIAPYTYAWTSNNPTFNEVTQDISNLPSSNYYLTLTDANGCIYSGYSDYINQPDSMAAIAMVIDSVSCLGSADGSIDLTINGGNPNASAPYFTYVWTGPSFSATTEDISGLAAGTYSVSVTDYKGCTASTSIVMPTIADTTDPVITCPGNQTQYTSATSCTYTHSGTAWNATATDNCVTPTLTWKLTGATTGTGSNTLSGVVFNWGVTTVKWYATDGLGNQDSCQFTVTIVDNVLPVANCKPATVTLNASGASSITAASIDNLSTDNCGIQSLTASTTSFSCSNVGNNTVTLTVLDIHGNSSTCQSTVTVIDATAPVATCQNVTVNLNTLGQASVTAAQVNNGSSDACGIATLSVSPSSFTCANVGANTVTLTVTDVNSNSSTCTATVTVVDAIPPTANCKNVTVNLNAAGSATITTGMVNNSSTDNCSIASMSLSQTNFGCANVGTNTVVLTVNDVNGNSSTCNSTVTVVDNTPPTAICQNVTANLNSLGQATVTAAQVNNGSTDACGILSLTLSQTAFTCANVGPVGVTLTVTDVNNNISTCNATVTVVDNVAPNAVCQNVTVNLSSTGAATVTAAQVNNNSTDACGIASYALSTTSFTCANVGANPVTLTVTDVNNNVSTCPATVTVVDNTNPTAVCKNISVNLNSGGSTSITAGQVNNGSYDNCSIASIAVNPSSFTCANVGANTVTLTVNDVNGHSSTCTSTVTVIDNTPPTAVCQNVTANLNASGNATVTAAHVNNGSSDACGILSTTLSQTSFSCANVGPVAVTLTVTDVNNNSSTCNATVTVVDNIAPTAVCQNVTVNLNASGNASIIASQVNNGSSDNCSIATYAVSPSAFTCANVGANTVTLTVTDVNSNVSTCSATVTVVDNIPPTANCKPLTLYLNSAGAASMTASQINNSSFDNCGILSVTASPTTFNCSNVGSNNVTLTVTDVNSNVSTCTAVVTVIDNIAPTAICQNTTINLNASGNASITPASINNGSFDNCSIGSMTVSQSAFGCSNVGNNTVTLTVTDVNSNVSTCTSTVTVIDNINPTITGCPSNISVNNDNGDCGAIVTWPSITFTDNCTFNTVNNFSSGDFFPVGTTNVVYTVTDASNNVSTCAFSITVTDNEDPVITCPASIASCDSILTFSDPVVSDNCGIQSVTLSGMTSGSDFPVGTTVNTYTVLDIHGNQSTCSFNVTVHPLPVITLAVTDVSCNGLSDGAINATITSGSAPFTYDWSNNTTNEDLTGVPTGTYTLDVTDQYGCTATATEFVGQPQLLTISGTHEDINCYGGNDGSIDVTVAGGILPYTYDWSNGETTEDVTGLTFGDYDVTVTDDNGCQVTYAVTLTQPDTLILVTAVYDATCTASNGSIQTILTGGTTPYTYAWSNGSTTSNLNNVAGGEYSLLVTDAHGCTVSFLDTVNTLDNLTAYILVNNVKCYGQNNGDAQVIVENGNAPYDYLWSNGGTNSIITDLVAGDYDVTVTDVFGCTAQMNITVNQPDSLSVTLTSSAYNGGNNISVYGGNDGYITSEVIGGSSPYVYLWSNGASTPDVSNLEAGAYSLIVTDNNGCTAYASSRMVEPDLLEMPEGYSPNGDGTNDYFVVHGIDAYPENNIVVYNRWGNIVYEFSNYQNEWNGDNTSGEPLPDGTYFVILTVQTGQDEITLKGYVDLRR